MLYPYLQEINIEGFTHEDWGPLTLIPVQIFEQWTHLRYLSVACSLTAPVLNHLSQLTSLETLHMLASSSLEIPLRPVPGIDFLELQELHLIADNFGDVLPLMRWIRLPRLREVRIHTGIAYSPASEVEELISLVARSKLLHEVNLITEQLFNAEDPPPRAVLARSALEPLLGLKELSKVNLQCNLAMTLDDEIVGMMARAWPRLKFLILISRIEPPTRSGATLAALIPLVVHCPQLVAVFLPLDAVVPEEFQRMDLRAQSPERDWKMLEIRYWTDIPDVPVASRFLTELFPSIHAPFKFIVKRINPLNITFPGCEDLITHVERLGRANEAQRALADAHNL